MGEARQTKSLYVLGSKKLAAENLLLSRQQCTEGDLTLSAFNKIHNELFCVWPSHKCSLARATDQDHDGVSRVDHPDLLKPERLEYCDPALPTIHLTPFAVQEFHLGAGVYAPKLHLLISVMLGTNVPAFCGELD